MQIKRRVIAGLRLASWCAGLLGFAGCAFAQDAPARNAVPLVLQQTQYRVQAGERVKVEAPSESTAFMLSAKTRMGHAASRTFPVAPNAAGDTIFLGVPLTTKPGDYTVALTFTNAAGEERTTTIQLTVEPFAIPEASSAVPPVVLLDGWQFSSTSSCPMSGSDSAENFGNLASYLTSAPNFAPLVYYFENCTECPNCPIEQLGAELANFLNLIPVPQVDVVAHSMGGLIVRSYLSGKQQTSGAFSPPLTPKIRKAVFIATPHFGSFQADSLLADFLFASGNQTNEMKRGSQFLWDLATWNQFGDDLRGVDALAVIGNAGSFEGLSEASDGVVALTSGSLDFALPGKTRIVNYCHIPLTSGTIEADYLGCTGPGIAYIDSPDHQTYQIVSSFLMSGNAWQGVGTSPAQDPYLSKYGGLVVADVNSADQYVNPGGVSWGSVTLTPGAAGDLYYNDLVDGSGTFTLGNSTCGPYTERLGFYSAARCKFSSRVFSVGPLLPGTARVVQAGTTITISGVAFGASQCGTCRVTAANPQVTTLQVSSWNDTTITAFLPASFVGIAQIGVTTATGFDAINIMAAAAVLPPMISLSTEQLEFSYTMSGSAPPSQTVTVANSGGGTLTWSASPSASWINVSATASALTVSVNPANLSAGPYSGTITITAPGASNSPLAISVTLTVTAPAPAPTVIVTSVANAASGAPGAIAPGEMVAIKGSGLGPAAGVSFSVDPVTGIVDTTLAGTRVFFGANAAAITYTSAGQINAIVPYEVAGQSQITMQVQYQGASSLAVLLQIASAAPGVFTFNGTGTGQAISANQDYSFNGASNPAAPGSFVTLYFTGGGQTNPAGVDGSVTGSVLKWLTQPVTVTVGGVAATVAFDGAAPTFVDGVGQLNIQLANNTPSGTQPLVVTVGGIPSPATATLSVQ